MSIALTVASNHETSDFCGLILHEPAQKNSTSTARHISGHLTQIFSCRWQKSESLIGTKLKLPKKTNSSTLLRPYWLITESLSVLLIVTIVLSAKILSNLNILNPPTLTQIYICNVFGPPPPDRPGHF